MSNKSLLQITLFLLLAKVSFGQNYLNSTARWTQRYSWTGFNASTNCHFTLYFAGDSLQNGITYMKLFQDAVCINNQTTYDSLGNPILVSDTNETTSLRALLREENKKFLVLETNGSESMRYDFGRDNYTSIDSVAPFNTCFGGGAPMITTHDTVCIGSIGRKRWGISMSQYPNASYLIEGVGLNTGIFSPACRNGCPECSYQLLSFVQNGDTLYQGTCEIPASTQLPEESLHFFMNETSLFFESHAQKEVELFTLNGQRIGHYSSVGHAGLEIPKQFLPNGLIFYRAKNGVKFSTGRFFIQQ